MPADNEVPIEDFPKISEKKELENAFDTYLIQLGGDLPRPEPEYRFHAKRKWRFDRAWPEYKVAVELEGGIYGKPLRCPNCHEYVRARRHDGSLGKVIHLGGGHSRFGRLVTDKEKYNAAVELGWYVLRFFREDVLGDPFHMIETIRSTLARCRTKIKLIDSLTDTEKEVLYLIAAGFQNPDISQRTNMAENSIRSVSQVITQKLCVSTRAAAVARALCWGLIEEDKIPFPTSKLDELLGGEEF